MPYMPLAALTAWLTGITEPIEFAFMFVAPVLYLIHAVLTGLWAEEKNTGDLPTLQAIIDGCGLDGAAVLKASEAPGIAEKREAYTKHAISQGVFGAPSYVIDGEIFWGQDRLDFVERKLAG